MQLNRFYYPDKPEKNYHKCEKPKNSRVVKDILWRCSECGIWWFSEVRWIFEEKPKVSWHRVRFWNVRLKERIKRIQKKEYNERNSRA